MVTPWSMTGHADMLERGLDGELGSHYNESCLRCHSVGYNKAPTAVNDGFDDLAAANGWVFPAVLMPGNFAAMPDEVKTMANIQCESCHGPGSSHPGSRSRSLSVDVCATCHNDGKYHNRPAQWKISPHNEHYYEISLSRGTRSSCARCHSPAGYLDTQKGEPEVRAEAGRLTCQVCHDPHNVEGYEHQVRVYGSVTLAGGRVLEGLGTSATCVYCHNARRSPDNVFGRGPHGGAQGDVFYGETGYTYGMPMGISAHSLLADCVDCHMYQNPGVGELLRNKIGDHTFSMTYDDGQTVWENIDACNQCHSDVDTFNYNGSSFNDDVDGDGAREGIQAEVDGLLQILYDLILATGVDEDFDIFDPDPVKELAQRAAVWNWELITNDSSHGVHNPQYTIRLLQLSYTNLSTTFGGNNFATDYPLADLR